MGAHGLQVLHEHAQPRNAICQLATCFEYQIHTKLQSAQSSHSMVLFSKL